MKSQDKSTGALIVENLFLGDPCQNWLNIYSWFGEYRNCPKLVPKTEEEQRNKLEKVKNISRVYVKIVKNENKYGTHETHLSFVEQSGRVKNCQVQVPNAAYSSCSKQ